MPLLHNCILPLDESTVHMTVTRPWDHGIMGACQPCLLSMFYAFCRADQSVAELEWGLNVRIQASLWELNL